MNFYMKLFMLTILLCFVGYIPANAMQEIEVNDPVGKKEVAKARKLAEKMERAFYNKNGWVYPQIYKSYMDDVEVIAREGKAPDNENLYDDLEMMNSDKVQLYYQRKNTY